MAEFGPTGLLAVLLLFTGLTLRDVYVGRSNPRPGSSADPELNVEPGTEGGKAAKAALYTGPVLRFRYW